MMNKIWLIQKKLYFAIAKDRFRVAGTTGGIIYC